MSLDAIVEAALFVAPEPLSRERLRALVGADGEHPEIDAAVERIAARYKDSALELVEVAGGWRFQVRSRWLPHVQALFEERPPRYSRALLETLAIIAYRQPVTRGEIEDIRGVTVSTNILRTLLDRQWVRVVGHKEVPGRPALYATTGEFLDYFNLKALGDLPSLPQAEPDAAEELPT